MRKKIEWQWERLDERTTRAKVIGGWLIRSKNFVTGKQALMSESMVFIADRDHEWMIVAPINPVVEQQSSISEGY